MSRGEIKQYVILWDNQPIYKYARKTSKTNHLQIIVPGNRWMSIYLRLNVHFPTQKLGSED